MQSQDPSLNRKSSEQKLAELALNIAELSDSEAAQQLLELSCEFRYYCLETEIVKPFKKTAADLQLKLDAKLKALQEEAAAKPVPAPETAHVTQITGTAGEVEPSEEETLTESALEETPVSEEVPVQQEMFTTTAEKKSLNDRLAGNDLKFGLNDRIGFVNDLFDGSQEDFNRTVSQLNTLGSLSEAMELIETDISVEYGWDQKEETAARFIAAVEQKFC